MMNDEMMSARNATVRELLQSAASGSSLIPFVRHSLSSAPAAPVTDTVTIAARNLLATSHDTIREMAAAVRPRPLLADGPQGYEESGTWQSYEEIQAEERVQGNSPNGKNLTNEQTSGKNTTRIKYNEGDNLPNLPEYKKAYCAPEKIIGYSLNMDHPSGRNKAIVFQSTLGFHSGNGEQLRQEILRGLGSAPAKVGPLTVYGQKFVVDMPITGPNGNTAIVRTAWIIRPGKTNPDLVSAYIKK